MNVPYAVNVLWLSRHTLAPTQLADFAHESGHELNTLVVTHKNLTYPARSSHAVAVIAAEAEEGDFDCVLGVFPAHIAGELVRQRDTHQQTTYWVPVSVSQFAEDGTPRGFEHSHWESLSGE